MSIFYFLFNVVRESLRFYEEFIGFTKFIEFFGADLLSLRQSIKGKTIRPESIFHPEHKKWRVRCNYELNAGEHFNQLRKDFMLVNSVKVQVNFVNDDNTSDMVGVGKLHSSQIKIFQDRKEKI